MDPALIDDPSLTCSPPVIMAPRSDGCEVVWAVAAPSLGWVEWVEGSDAPPEGAPRHVARCDAFGFVPHGDEVIRVRVDRLAAGRTHLLRTVTVSRTDRAGDDAERPPRRAVSPWRRFRTLDPDATATSFAVWSDTHDHADALARLDAATPPVDVLVWNGDVCNNWVRRDMFADTVLRPGGRDISVDRPVAVTWGNHDVRGPWASRLREFVATPSGLPYYAVRTGPVAAVFLHTGEDKPDDHPSFEGRPAFAELRQRQTAWLAEQLRQPGFADAPYRVVFCHIPLRWRDETVLTARDYADAAWDVYARSCREQWHPLLSAWGAQVVLSGHNHVACRLDATDEFPYVQLMGGGWEPPTATWMQGRADADRLVITTRKLDGRIVDELELPPLA